jgi:LacI family transcriptional regulator/LacI family purine nucleotide synthesis repressor/LacI family repressor for deo operon, udp, cdd, tsx, nupC, and nupG
MRKDTLTIYDIARMAEVSVSTVSRVLNDKSVVNERTRQKVLEIVARHNFQPNRLAQSLLKKESMTIGCILPDITNLFFSTVFLQTELYAAELGYTMLLCNSLNNRDVESSYLRVLLERRVDGILFMGGRINDSQPDPKLVQEMQAIGQRVPLVMINGTMSEVDSYVIQSDESQGFTDLIQYLYNIGHRKMALIGGIAGVTSTDVKTCAFHKAVETLGLITRSSWMIPHGFSIESGGEAMQLLLQQVELPTAVLAINDLVAIGAIKEAQRQGLRVPEDISVAGFDDTSLAQICTPALTTVNQNYTQLARIAMDTLIAVVTGQPAHKLNMVETRVILRDSCRAITNPEPG